MLTYIKYSLKHEQQCFIRFRCFRPDKTRVASVLNGFKYDPFHKFNGVVIL